MWDRRNGLKSGTTLLAQRFLADLGDDVADVASMALKVLRRLGKTEKGAQAIGKLEFARQSSSCISTTGRISG